MMRTAASLALLLMVISETPAPAQRNEAPSPPVLVVHGNAEIPATPDEAAARLGIVRQAPSAQAAQEQVNSVAQGILTAVAKLGIITDRIRTSRLTLTPVYAPQRPEGREPPRIVAYNAANIVTIEVENLDRIGPVIDAGLTAGANQLEGVQFRLKNDLAAREQALKLAVTEARRKAEAMAEALGVRLQEVLEVSEGGVSIMPRQDVAFVEARAVGLAVPTPVSPGQIDVHASVVVKYRIQPR
jgi:hypothetical protein